MTFDEDRFRRGFLKKLEDRIEPLDVADLQDEIFLFGEFAQLGGLRGIVGDGFLDENVLPRGQRLTGLCGVEHSGSGQHHRLDVRPCICSSKIFLQNNPQLIRPVVQTHFKEACLRNMLRPARVQCDFAFKN